MEDFKMYGKIVDDKIKYANVGVGRLTSDDTIVLNPRTDEDFVRVGYYPLTPVELPENTETTYYYNQYEIIDGAIVGVLKSGEITDELI